MQDRVAWEEAEACRLTRTEDLTLWQEYSASRPFLASSPAAQAALIITKNRQAIIQDISKRAELPTTESAVLEEALQFLVHLLLKNRGVEDVNKKASIVRDTVVALTAFLDERMCVPRDMGAMSAACIKKLAVELREQEKG